MDGKPKVNDKDGIAGIAGMSRMSLIEGGNAGRCMLANKVAYTRCIRYSYLP